MISNSWRFIPIAEVPLWLDITSTKSSILPFVASRDCCAMSGHFSFIKGIKLSIFSSNHFSEITSFSGSSELFSFLLLLWEDGKSPLFKLIYFKIRPYFLNFEPLSEELFDLYSIKTYKSLFTFYLSALFCKKVLLSYY